MNRRKVSLEGSVAVVEWLDAFAFDDLEQVLTEMVNTPGFHDGTPLLIVEPGGGTGPPPKLLEESAVILKSFASRFGNRIAMTVKQDVHFGLGRMLEVYCELQGVFFRPFRDPADAKQWLLGSAA